VTFIDEYGHDLRGKALKGASNGDFWRYVQTRLQPSDTVFRLIAWQLLTPVAYLHKNNVAHRDLKNENFLVSGEIITEANEAVPIVKVCLRAVRALTRPLRHLDPLSLL
jgi:serine/threonine protein kinase